MMSVQFKIAGCQSLILPIVFIILFIGLIIGESSWAQSAARSSSQGKYLGLYCNIGIESYRDDLLVPLGFHGPGLSLGGVYTCRSEKESIDIRFKLVAGFLKIVFHTKHGH